MDAGIGIVEVAVVGSVDDRGLFGRRNAGPGRLGPGQHEGLSLHGVGVRLGKPGE